MPKVTLYVSDDLKARMDAAGEVANWSALAQQAFLKAVLTQAVSKDGSNMSGVVERLRASKERIEARDREAGKTRGTEWAKQDAEWDELERVATYEGNIFDEEGGGFSALARLIRPDDEWNPHYLAKLMGPHRPSDDFVEGFMEGATEVYDEVADQVHNSPPLRPEPA